ncbi:MAG: hypothetical protein ACN4GZ_19640 [Acidimicrobiales bacterium]
MPDELDDLIGGRLRAAVPRENNSQGALAAARPAMSRARRVRQIQTTVASVAILAGLGAVGLVALNSSDGDRRTIIADAPEQSTTTASTTSGVTTTSTPTTVTPATSTPSEPQGTSAPTTVPGSTETTNPPTTQTSSTSAPTTTRSGELGPGSHIIDSDCGSITVDIVDTAVALLDVRPLPGFDPEIDDESAEKVKVEFEGGAGHCELKVEGEDDGVFFSVSNESAHD